MQEILWLMQGIQMIVWFWMQAKGGHLPDSKYFYFASGMMIGQLGAAIDCAAHESWGPFLGQLLFLLSTAFGTWQRYREIKKKA